MSQFRELINLQNTQDNFIDLSVNSFDRKIQGTLREIDNDIIRQLTEYTQVGKLKKVNFEFALANKVQLENLLRSAGYYGEVETLMIDQLALIDDVIKEYDLFNYKLKFMNINREAIRELIKNSTVVFENIGIQATNQIYNGIYDSLLTDTALKDAIPAIRNTIADIKLKSYAGTYANTEMMKFNRSVSATMSNQTGWDRYQFMGPIDAKISHDFCIKHVGEIMTKEKIDEYSQQYGFNIFINGGGYNCRHKWINVPPWYNVSKQEQTMIDTNLRIAKETQELRKTRKKKAA